MKRGMRYKGHFGSVEFDPKGRVLIGRLAGISDIVTFQADAPASIITAFRKAVDEYHRTCEAGGKKPDKPHSGKLTIRVEEKLHAELMRAAELSGMSFNAWAEAALKRAADEVHDDAEPV